MSQNSHSSSWTVVPLGKFVESEKGKKPKNQAPSPDKKYIYPYVDIEAFEEGKIKSWADGEGCRFCSEEDFLMVWDGSRSGLVGKGVNGALGSTLVRINFPRIENNYAFYFLKSKYLEINSRTKGSGTPHVDPDLLWNYEFPVAPLAEQQRIISKLEELLSELDKGIESFKTAREQLTVYRQAVLKHAFEGKLTEEWRKKHADALEPAETLLKIIKAEREQRYRQQLDDWKRAVKTWGASGKKGKKPTKPGKPKELPPLTEEESAELPELPVGWGWAKLGQLTWSVKDGPHYSPKYEDEGIPFISGGNIRPNGIDFSSAKYISKELHEELSHRCKPEVGDILYSKGGTTGIARVNTYEIDFNVWVHVAVLKVTESTDPSFLQNALNSPFCYSQAQKFTHGVGNQDLGLTRMVNIVLAICNATEQCKVIEEIESRLSVAEKLEQDIEDGLKQAETLRQSLLKKAFEGRLVPQNSDDEPASLLLERIKMEKAKLQQKARKEKKVAG